MKSLPSDLARLATEPDTLAPESAEDVSSILRHASKEGLRVQVRGGGTRSGFGAPPTPDLVMSMENLTAVEAYEPDDLTLVVQAGARVDDVESTLIEHNQTAVLPERPGDSTVGGVIASGASSFKRGRLFGTRERLLEATVVTGDGRVVRGGGRVVKNVTGYDLPRLMVGAFGSLGVIVSVCLKLWPAPPDRATVTVDSPEAAAEVARPLAILQDNESTRVYVWGTAAEIEAQTAKLGGGAEAGHHWPAGPVDRFGWSLRVPPANLTGAIERLPTEWRYVALHGVGEIRAASPSIDGAADLRSWAEDEGGRLVVTVSPEGGLDGFDPWGRPPPGIEFQKRLIAEFDPARVINPGRLPGGL